MTDRTCSIDGCDGKTDVRGWCSKHYSSWRRYGDPTAALPRTWGFTVAERIAFYTRKTEAGCLEWTGGINSSGYGRIWVGHRTTAHRAAYELAHGRIPDGLLVLHHCDNPPCCNVDHLYLGTPQDNVDDMLRRGRHKAPKGSGNGNSKLTEADVLAIRADTRLQREIAADYGVTDRLVSAILSRKIWKHV